MCDRCAGSHRGCRAGTSTHAGMYSQMLVNPTTQKRAIIKNKQYEVKSRGEALVPSVMVMCLVDRCMMGRAISQKTPQPVLQFNSKCALRIRTDVPYRLIALQVVKCAARKPPVKESAGVEVILCAAATVPFLDARVGVSGLLGGPQADVG